jgi:hypothetical protein
VIVARLLPAHPVPMLDGEANQSVAAVEPLTWRETGTHAEANTHDPQVGMAPTANRPLGQVTCDVTKFVLDPATNGPVTYVHPETEKVPAGP